MKKVLVFILIVYGMSCYSQNTKSKIEIKKRLGTVFIQDGKSLIPRDMLKIMKENPAAFSEMQTARGHFTAASIFAYSGGFLIGWSVTPAIYGEKLIWPLAVLGASLVITSIPFNSVYMKHAKNAVGIYNDGLKTSQLKSNYNVNLVLTGNGAGIRVNF